MNLRNLLVASVAAVALAVPPGAASAAAAQHYVAPDGHPGADGSKERPWDLATALAHPPAVKPGDTIWIRGGTYGGAFTSRLRGEPSAPIVLHQYPGERAVIDGAGSPRAVLTIFGEWAIYWGFEITNSDPQRVTSSRGSSPKDLSRGTQHGIIVKGPHTKLINLVVHDTGVGIGFWSEAPNAELYGNIIFYNGWQAPDRGHGHGIYAQNDTGTKRIADNIVFQQFGSGLMVYGSERAALNNFVIEGNVLFNNGGLSQMGRYTRNILLGGGTVARNPVIVDNYTYFAPAPRPGVESIAIYAGAQNAVIKRNYFVHGTSPQYPAARALQLGTVQGLEMTDNVFQGSVLGFDPAQYPENEYDTLSRRAQGKRIFVRPNEYEPGRAHIIVYNFAHLPTVTVDLAKHLRRGERYVILDAQNFYGPPVVEGIFDGRAVNVPMRLTKLAPPTGTSGARLRHTAPEFAVFVLLRSQ
jgi:hypothetical protein